MSGIEILAIAASVIQVADMGARLSVKLYTFTRKAKNADRNIQEISQEIAATGAALRELGEVLGEDRFASLGSQQSINSTEQIAADCRKIFADINKAIGGRDLMQAAQGHGSDKPPPLDNPAQAGFDFKQRLKFPFIEPQIDLLRAKLESLKTSLILMLQVLSLAEQIRNRPNVRIADEQRTFIQTLVSERNTLERRCSKLMKSLEYHTVSGSSEREGLSRHRSSSKGSNQSEFFVKTTLQPKNSVVHSKSYEVRRSTEREIALVADDTQSEQGVEKTDATIASIDIPSSNDRIDPANADGDQDQVNLRIRIRQHEIEDHAALVSRLLQEISDVQYRIDHGIRDRMQKGLLRTHWDEWSPLAERYGDQFFMKTFSAHSHVLRYWLDQDDLQAGGNRAQTEEEFESKMRERFRNAGYSDDHVERILREKRDRSWAIDLSRPTYIKVNRKYLSPDTLDTYHLPWEWDKEDTEYIIIKQYIDEEFQDILFKHTKTLKEKRLITSGYDKDVVVKLKPSGYPRNWNGKTRWPQKIKDSLRQLGKFRIAERHGHLDESDVDVLEEDEDEDVVKIPPGDSLSIDKRTEKTQDQMYVVRKKTRPPAPMSDEVEDLLLQWTDLTKDELLNAGVAGSVGRSYWMFT